MGTDPAWDYVEANFESSTGQPLQHSTYCHIGHGRCDPGNAASPAPSARAHHRTAPGGHRDAHELRTYCDEVSI
ncbi:hypothetical protein GG851_12995 [Bordetella petrii]|nr:hypothetical protein [Bordetella petrii]